MADAGREWLTVGQAAERLSVSDTTLREYADNGRLDEPVPMTRLPGRHRRIHVRSLDRLYREIYGDSPPTGQ